MLNKLEIRLRKKDAMRHNQPHIKALSVSGLSVHYGQNPVLWDISLDVPPGNLVGIIGPNGAGKTTFIKAVLDLIDISTGSIYVLNHRFSKIRKKIAYVPQRTVVDWNFPMTVHDLVLMGVYPQRGLLKRVTSQDYEDVQKALCTVGLQQVQDKEIYQLSGGQQQRAFLARSIVQKADLYFLDEPFEGIDVISEKILMDVLHSMKQEGKTVFMVHHDLVSAEKYFTWCIILNTCLVANGPFQQTFTAENLHLAYGSNFALVGNLLQNESDLAAGTVSE